MWTPNKANNKERRHKKTSKKHVAEVEKMKYKEPTRQIWGIW